jgi:predicted ATPase/DNA-binding XRE family transcriptional regulator
MQDEISFGKWLRKQRRALDFTRQAFANQVGCAEVTLRRIEAGTLKPSKELANILLEKLDIPETERPQWISFARGLSGFPPQSLPSSNNPNSNLPAPLTTFIGREKEQTDAIRLISKYRLVTLTGSGGVGKTRLSIKVGEQVLGNYVDGVWLVELAPILDPSLVPRTIALTLGLRDDPQRRIIDLLCDYMREKRMLLLLDNCEHVLDGCAQLIDEVLKTCPHLKILVTSREPLNITGEAIYRVPSLGLPNLEQILDTFRNYESIQLFEERAQLVQFDFSLTLENAASVAQICQRLDGIPLAIELAAAKVAVFSPEQMAKQLQESFNLLAQGSRTALPRHQTLRASINWSWNLLTESEQRLIRQLSVFAGGWTLEAAQSVCDGDILYLLNSLVAKSLIVMNQRPKNNTRYSFHETIRQYAREKLLEASGSEVVRNRHLVYFVKLAEQADPELYRSKQVFWLNKLANELDNIRVALEWALAIDVESGLRIASSSWRFWDSRGYMQELREWLRPLLEHHTWADNLCAQSWAVYSYCYYRQGYFSEAISFATHSLQLARKLANQQTEAFSLSLLGVSTLLQGNVREGTHLLENGLTLYRALGDKMGQAKTLEWLAFNTTSNPERTMAFIKESLGLYRELGNLTGITVCLNSLSQITMRSGDFKSPLPWVEEALSISRQLGDQTNEAYILSLSAALAYWQGNYQQAKSYYHEVLLLTEKTGDNFLKLWIHVHIGYAFLHQGNIQQARALFVDSIHNTHTVGLAGILVFAVEGMASLYVDQNQFKRATQLFAWTDAMREELGDHRPLVEQRSVERDLAIIHSKLDDAEFAKFSEEGRLMTKEQVITLALDTAEEM